VAELVTNIDVARAQLAKETAEAQTAAAAKGEQLDTPTNLTAQAALERADLRLRAASK
jgi:F0F1-type ATP synthase epsilon subunit